jgi:hypothetical protein
MPCYQSPERRARRPLVLDKGKETAQMRIDALQHPSRYRHRISGTAAMRALAGVEPPYDSSAGESGDEPRTITAHYHFFSFRRDPRTGELPDFQLRLRTANPVNPYKPEGSAQG